MVLSSWFDLLKSNF